MNSVNIPMQLENESNICCEDLQPLRNVHEIISGLYSSKQRAVNKCDILTAIENLKLLRNSGEINGNTVKHIDNEVGKLLIATIACKPAFCDDQLSSAFLDYWNTFALKAKKLLMPRNIHILGTQSNGSQSWIKYEQILVKLFTKNLVTAQIIEREGFASLKEEWSDDVLDKLAAVLQALVDCSKRLNARQSELMEVVEWLAWFCSKTNEF